MDPWLESKLRLADRLGLLKGNRLTRVQYQAAQFCLVLDARDRGQDFADRIGLAIITNNPEKAPVVFPKWISQAPTVVDRVATIEDYERDAAGTYHVEAPPPDEIEALLGRLSQQMSVGVMKMTEASEWDDDE